MGSNGIFYVNCRARKSNTLREDRFDLEIEFNDVTQDFTWQKDNVATAVLLRQKSDGAKLCLGAAHIFWSLSQC